MITHTPATAKELGDKVKAFEKVETCRTLTPGLPIVVRLDGRSFHTFTKGMPRPYHLPMSQCMIETTKFLVAATQADFGYTQSDEITLVYTDTANQESTLFKGRIQKLVSILASMATAKFNQLVTERLPERMHLLPVFDARVFNVPNLDEVINCVQFRTIDCVKNSIATAAQTCYKPSELARKNGTVQRQMLWLKGINWEEYPPFFKYGTFVQRHEILKELSPTELAKIPEKHRPTGPVRRTEVSVIDGPAFHEWCNPKAVLFGREKPQTFLSLMQTAHQLNRSSEE